MKSPTDLRYSLSRQWRNARLREARLLGQESWPLRVPVGKPSADEVTTQPEQVRGCLKAWREVAVGEVCWTQMNYRHLTDGLDVPSAWVLHKPSEWIDAIDDVSITKEFQKLSEVIAAVDEQFRSLLVQKLHLIQQLPAADVITAATVAMVLEPGQAGGVPLRAINIAGIDSKFFERNRRLITALLDIRYEGSVSEVGLETFLDAARGTDQWLLLADLDGRLLPFDVIRVRDTELATVAPPGTCLLIVENEKCLHALPKMPDTIAILGAGLNLTWLSAPWLQSRRVAYWGDIDTWGLTMLGRAREWVPDLVPLLMDQHTFDKHANRHSVAEPTTAGADAPANLTADEQSLYRLLLSLDQGRLEQEFVPATEAREAILSWVQETS